MFLRLLTIEIRKLVKHPLLGLGYTQFPPFDSIAVHDPGK